MLLIPLVRRMLGAESLRTASRGSAAIEVRLPIAALERSRHG
jgi:hypothetical protein